jgi:hypothetical protein
VANAIPRYISHKLRPYHSCNYRGTAYSTLLTEYIRLFLRDMLGLDFPVMGGNLRAYHVSSHEAVSLR